MSIRCGSGTSDEAENKRESSHGADIYCSWGHELYLQSSQRLSLVGIITLWEGWGPKEDSWGPTELSKSLSREAGPAKS